MLSWDGRWVAQGSICYPLFSIERACRQFLAFMHRLHHPKFGEIWMTDLLSCYVAKSICQYGTNTRSTRAAEGVAFDVPRCEPILDLGLGAANLVCHNCDAWSRRVERLDEITFALYNNIVI